MLSNWGGGASQSTTNNNIILPFTVAGVIDEDEGRRDQLLHIHQQLMWNNSVQTVFILDCRYTYKLMAKTHQ